MTDRTFTIVRLGALAAFVAGASLTASPALADDEAEMAEASDVTVVQLVDDDDYEYVAGGLVVSEPALPPPSPPDPSPPEEPVDDGTSEAIAESQVFALHSKPGADRVIFLDVDGHTLTGTAWNHGRSDPIVVGSYSRESYGSENDGFSSSELAAIQEIWQRVSEDFAPWDVDVTTEDPGDAALQRNGADDEQYGVRVVITHDAAWYGAAGGVAFVGGYGSTFYSPAFVFSSHLAQGSPKSVAEATSHEVGHTLGLLHDGQHTHLDGNGQLVGGTAYYGGHGHWAPIMGVGYSRQVTQWSAGAYTAANNAAEDDLAEIDSFLPGRAPSSEPSPLPTTDSSTVGTIETGGGSDTYLLSVGGSADVSLSQHGPGGNLLAELRVTPTAGGPTTVRSLQPPADPHGWSHRIDDLPAGEYRVEVRSIGYGSATSGFTDYASIGRYVLSVDHSGPTAPPPTSPPPGGPPPPGGDAGDPGLLTTTSPARLLDTREAGAPHRLPAGGEIRVDVAGRAGVSSDATAAVINVVAVQPAGNGYLSVTPCNDVAAADRTSSLNFTAGRNIANSTIATLSSAGQVCIFSSAATDVVVDVTGSIGPTGSVGLAATGTRRLVDTRNGTGLPTRLGQDARLEIFLDEVVGPATTAVALNVTAVGPGGPGFVTLDDCGSGSGRTAALNYSTGENRGNNGIFALSPRRSLCLGNTSPLDLTIDLTGEFRPGGLSFVPAEPRRLLDTRHADDLSARSSVEFDVPSLEGELTAAAASVNIASAQHPTSGYVTAWSCGSMPESSALNPVAGQVTANGALVGLTDAGRSCLFHSAGGELIVDLNGWWI